MLFSKLLRACISQNLLINHSLEIITPYMNNKIKVIIFDLGKVIVNFDHMHICKKLSKHSAFEPVRIYDIIFNSGLEASFDKGLISPENFYSRVKKAVQLKIDEDSFKKIWTKIFTLNPGITELISSLKNRYKLLCLSNTNTWHFNYCMQKFQVLKLFDGFILSYKVGKTKPAQAIFKKTIQHADEPPANCMYIDDIIEYVEEANIIGINGIHFRTIEKLKKELSEMNII